MKRTLHRVRHKYAGADWLEVNLKYARKQPRGRRDPKLAPHVSDFGRLVADIVGFVVRGLYHLDNDTIERVDWANEDFIALRWTGELASHDFSELSMLLVLCHDACVRVSICTERGQFVSVRFHRRHGREGHLCERHPHLDEHIEMIRRAYTVEPPMDLAEGSSELSTVLVGVEDEAIIDVADQEAADV